MASFRLISLNMSDRFRSVFLTCVTSRFIRLVCDLRAISDASWFRFMFVVFPFRLISRHYEYVPVLTPVIVPPVPIMNPTLTVS